MKDHGIVLLKHLRKT